MQQTNLFYRPQILDNLSHFLSMKDLLKTSTLSKQFNLILRKHIKHQYLLKNNQDQFQQLRSLFNRNIYTFDKTMKFALPNQQKISLRNINSTQSYSLIKGLDNQYRITQTHNLTLRKAPTQQHHIKYQKVDISESKKIYCANKNDILCRINLNNLQFDKGQNIKLNGQIIDIACCYKYTLVAIRNQKNTIQLMVFDDFQPLQKNKIIKTPFEISQINFKQHAALGKGNNHYLVLNETLYELDLKNGSVNLLNQLIGKKVVKVKGGKHHFIAYLRTTTLSSTWQTQDVIKFAHEQGFQDYIKIFKAEKVTGKILLQMDKKYMEEVLGIQNVKIQQKLRIRLQDLNKQNEQSYMLLGWGRNSEGQLGINPSKQINKPIKIKLPVDCQLFEVGGNFTIIYNKKTRTTLVNIIDQNNKLQWKQVTNRKVWDVSVNQDIIFLVCSAQKEKVHQRDTQNIVVEKKQKFRTAKNIIDKITWDQNLKAQQFKVGFLDKYDGLLQISFKQLQQSEVKQYRIQYFKKGDKIVWNKKNRIDIL